MAKLQCFPFDIGLADYRLPGWTGMDAFGAMRQAGRNVPFILVTGVLGEEIAVECIKQGITDYVLKEHSARLPIVVARALEERALRDARAFMVQALPRQPPTRPRWRGGFGTICCKSRLVLLDVIMPWRSGPEVFAAIEALRPGISVVFATGYTNEMATLAEVGARGIAVLRKPYSPSTLCRVIREVLDGAAVRAPASK